MGIVTLLTDFGMRDSYVAQMKGVILGDAPSCQLVDISHSVRPFSILEGAFLLETAVGYFPPGTIHVAVVDPGVGGKRLPLIVECKNAILIGPDNGLLSRAADKLVPRSFYRIRAAQIGANQVSSTFHGRDIFAKAAALIAKGFSPGKVGPRVSRMRGLEVPGARMGRKHVNCIILHVDGFGNLITSVPNSFAQRAFQLGQQLSVESKSGKWRIPYFEAYSKVRREELLVLQGGQGYLEIAAREADASRLLGLRAQDQLDLGLG